MGRGGLETWLMNVLRRIDRKRYKMDFLVQTEEKRAYDDEILSLGSRILRIRAGKLRPSYILFLRDFRSILERCGPYDVVHAHDSLRYGTLLREAAKAGVPVRIMHSHSIQVYNKRIIKWPFHLVSSRCMHKYATVGLGCSRDACASMFGKNWSKDPRYRALYYGIDLKAYKDKKDGISVRKEFGIPRDFLVIGHIGRFALSKNHDFIVDIARELIQQRDDVRFLLVGNGSEKARIEQRINEMKLTDYFIFAGLRSDVPRMLSAMDVFVMPSIYEGLGIVLLEAQAKGLPCLMTHSLPSDVNVVKELCHRLSLGEGPRSWANKLVKLCRNCKVDPVEAYNIVKASHFNIDVSVHELTEVYEQGVMGGLS
jgi:glycosyltransferase involved in cell wall biosynthesis